MHTHTHTCTHLPPPAMPRKTHSFSAFCCFILGTRISFIASCRALCHTLSSNRADETFRSTRKLRQSRYGYKCICTSKEYVWVRARILRLSIDSLSRFIGMNQLKYNIVKLHIWTRSCSSLEHVALLCRSIDLRCKCRADRHKSQLLFCTIYWINFHYTT